MGTGDDAVDARNVGQAAGVSVSTEDNATHASSAEGLVSVSTGDDAMNAKSVEA